MHGYAFCFFIFSKWKKDYNSLLMTHLRCTVVHYANWNSSPINKSFLNDGQLNMLFFFFWFLIYVYFNEAFVKKVWNNSFFNTNFISRCSILRRIRMSNLDDVILTQNLKKCLTYFLKDCRRKSWRFRINRNWKSVSLCHITWQPLKIFAKLHKSPLLIANI